MHVIPLNAEVKFALYDYNGKPKSFFIARPTKLPAPAVSSEMGHHVVIIDRSGSMWGSPITETKVMVEKVLTVEEYKDSEMLVSLISYSSQGDYTVHFERIPVSEVMAPESIHVQNIRRIQATYLTCVSQALDYAKTLVRSGETTAISVHTDGYFNDASPAAESRKIDGFIASMKDVKNVFVNTIAYGYADTGILMKLANALSGKCVQAKTVKEVYDALHDTTALLAGRSLPPIIVEIDGADYQALVSVSARKVNGTTLDLKVRGLKPTDDATVWRYRKVTETAWDASQALVAAQDTLQPVYAFLRAKLAEGQLNAAKYALMATRNLALVEAHAKALTVEQRAAFAMDVERYITGDATCTTWGTDYGMGTSRMSVQALCDLLQRKKGDWVLDLPEFMAGYKKRGVKRIPGEWEKVITMNGKQKVTTYTGKLIPPNTKLVPTDDPATLSVAGFKLNNDTANLNMLVYRDADVCDYATGKVNKVVAGKKLDIQQFRAYTLVGDGAVNAQVLPIRIASPHLHSALVVGKVLADTPYDPHARHDIPLATLAVLDYDTDFTVPTGVYEQMLGLKVQSSLYGACLEEGVKASLWTPEQIAEFKSKDLTPALSHSTSTTTPYIPTPAGLQGALQVGEVDTRTSYTIDIMNTKIAGIEQLYGANVYLNRRFTVKVPVHPAVGTGLDREGLEAAVAEGRLPAKALEPIPELGENSCLKKATMLDALLEGAVVKRKVLTPKVEAGLDVIDALMMPYFETFFVESSSRFKEMDGVDQSATLERIAERKVQVDAELEKLRAQFRPIAFYIGATGLLPASWGDVPALTDTDISAKYPALFLSKAQKEATFFEIGSVILAVYATNAYYSTPLGVEKAKSIMKSTGNDADEEVE